MLQEVQDIYGLLTAVHTTTDKMLEGLSDEDWARVPAAGFNSIVSVIEHVVLVENRFLSVLSGDPQQIDSQRPFKEGPSEVAAVRQQWADTLPNAEKVFANVTAEQLDAHAVKLGVGELNGRQLLSYMVAHTAHHRGQIPLLKRLLG